GSSTMMRLPSRLVTLAILVTACAEHAPHASDRTSAAIEGETFDVMTCTATWTFEAYSSLFGIFTPEWRPNTGDQSCDFEVDAGVPTPDSPVYQMRAHRVQTNAMNDCERERLDATVPTRACSATVTCLRDRARSFDAYPCQDLPPPSACVCCHYQGWPNPG